MYDPERSPGPQVQLVRTAAQSKLQRDALRARDNPDGGGCRVERGYDGENDL